MQPFSFCHAEERSDEASLSTSRTGLSQQPDPEC
jgi:hypothetical protein